LDIHSGEREPTQALDAVRGPKQLREQRKKRRENDRSHQVARGLRKADLNGIVTHGLARLASQDPTFNRSTPIRVFTHSPPRLGPNRRPHTPTNAGWQPKGQLVEDRKAALQKLAEAEAATADPAP